jgi:hypothetical protein
MNGHELLRAVAAAQAAMGEEWAALIEWPWRGGTTHNRTT